MAMGMYQGGGVGEEKKKIVLLKMCRREILLREKGHASFSWKCQADIFIK